jgi:hypothetical protein
MYKAVQGMQWSHFWLTAHLLAPFCWLRVSCAALGAFWSRRIAHHMRGCISGLVSQSFLCCCLASITLALWSDVSFVVWCVAQGHV